MARSQEDGITTLLRLKDCKVRKITGKEETVTVEVEIKGN